MPRWVRVYLVPGAIFQSVMIGGGYGTGRELVEYFVQFGVGGALKGIAVSTALMAAILAVTFEFARCFRVYDYRSFFKRLIGPAWLLFDIFYIFSVVLVLAVVASASGELLADALGLSVAVGGLLMLGLVVTLNFYGREVVTRVLSGWSAVLYVVFGAVLISVWATQSESLAQGLRQMESHPGWLGGALKYAWYNAGLGPIILFATRELKTRREAIGSAAAAASIGMAPALMFIVTLSAGYPEVVARALPNYYMLSLVGLPVLTLVFLVVLFGTFVETGAGMIQGIIERVDAWSRERRGVPVTPAYHASISLGILSASMAVSSFGIIAIVARGYGAMAWLSLVLYALPVMTLGPWLLWRRGRAA